MRIWHQSFTVLEDLPDYERVMRAHIKKVVQPTTEVTIHGQIKGTYSSNYPGSDLAHSAFFNIHGLQWIVQALAAQREKVDAFAMCTIPNPLIREIRTLVDFPVVGYGEACCHMACMLGHRFGILVFIDTMIPLLKEQVSNYGLQSRCTDIRPVGFTFQHVLSAFSDPDEVLEKFYASARGMIKDGASVIIPGEMPLNLLLAANDVRNIEGVPIMDGLAVTLQMAEYLVNLKRTTGLTQSRDGFFGAAPDPGRVMEVLSFYGLDTLADR